MRQHHAGVPRLDAQPSEELRAALPLALVLELQRVDVERGRGVDGHRAAVAPLPQRRGRASVAVVLVAIALALLAEFESDDVVWAAFVQRGLAFRVDHVERRCERGTHVADDVWLVA